MTNNPKTYLREFKQQIVDLYHTGNYSIQHLSYRYDISKAILLTWERELYSYKGYEIDSVSLQSYNELKEELLREKVEKAIIKEKLNMFEKNIKLKVCKRTFTTYFS